MDAKKMLVMLAGTMGLVFLLAGCGSDGIPLSGSQTHRGEADGTNPVRGVTIQNYCQNNAGDKNVDTTINNTNNCNKNNNNSTNSGTPEG